MRIDEVEGIGAAYAEKLAAAGISSTDDLLAKAGPRKGRADLEAATGISGALILKWLNRVDLLRIPGVGSEYSDLLEMAGVDSPAELAQRSATNLAQTFQEAVAARPGTVRRIPSADTVAGWVEAAKALPRIVEH